MSDSICQNNEVFKLLAVIVLYKMKPSMSISLETLQKSITRLSHENNDINILLYDNTPGGQDVVVPSNVTYVAAPTNNSLADAYNYAIKMAHDIGCDWLLTLDQDTTLPLDFLCKIRCAALNLADKQDIAAIVPHIYSDGRSISPAILTKPWGQAVFISDGYIGAPSQETIASNSGSTFKVKCQEAVGGYNREFWLDCSDLLMYHNLHSNGMKVFVAGDIRVVHELSNFDLNARSTPDRYRSLLLSEESFYDKYMGRIARFVLLLKLFRRVCYSVRSHKGSSVHVKITAEILCRRLFHTRKYRMQDWKRSAACRMQDS